MELTEWYPAEIKPVHVGWYKVKGLFEVGEYLMRWGQWRGLTEPHHGS